MSLYCLYQLEIFSPVCICYIYKFESNDGKENAVLITNLFTIMVVKINLLFYYSLYYKCQIRFVTYFSLIIIKIILLVFLYFKLY